MKKSWKTTANVLAGFSLVGFGLSWWDYARTEQEYRHLFLDSSRLLIQLNQVKGSPSSPNPERCSQLNPVRTAYLNLIRQDNPPSNPITAALVGGKAAVIQNMLGRIRADLETLNAECAKSP